MTGGVRRHVGDDFSEWDAAYVLGALSGEDRGLFEAHLSECDQCRLGVASIAGVPGLLARVPVDQLYSDESERLPAAVLPRLLAQAARDRRRDRWRLAVAGLVAAACVVGLLVTIATLGRRASNKAGGTVATTSTASALPLLRFTPVGQVAVGATAQVQSVAWGTRIAMRCTYTGPSAGAGPSPSTGSPYASGSYSLVVLGQDRVPEQIATWRPVPGKTIQIEGDTRLRRADITEIRVENALDTVVLTVTL